MESADYNTSSLNIFREVKDNIGESKYGSLRTP